MQTEIIWKKQFKQSSAFNITPIADPFNPNYFYVGGGAEDNYGKYTRLRRLSFATGEEEASVSLKNNIKEIYFTPDTQFILVLSDDYLLRIQRENLLIIDIYDKNFPKTVSCMAFNHQPIFFLMNSADKSLFAFNCVEGTKKRKVTKIASKFTFPENERLLMFFEQQQLILTKEKDSFQMNFIGRKIIKE